MRRKLRAGFAVGIRVISVEWFVLPIAPFPFFILIYLVGRDVYDGTNAAVQPHALQ